jgi:hypothetical protein
MTTEFCPDGNQADKESYLHDANDNVVSQMINGATTTDRYDRNRVSSGSASLGPWPVMVPDLCGQLREGRQAGSARAVGRPAATAGWVSTWELRRRIRVGFFMVRGRAVCRRRCGPSVASLTLIE